MHKNSCNIFQVKKPAPARKAPTDRVILNRKVLSIDLSSDNIEASTSTESDTLPTLECADELSSTKDAAVQVKVVSHDREVQTLSPGYMKQLFTKIENTRSMTSTGNADFAFMNLQK